MQVDTITVGGVQLKEVTDLAKETVLQASDFTGGISDTNLFALAMDKAGVREFRYLLPSTLHYGPGGVTVAIAGGTGGAARNQVVTDAAGNATPLTYNAATNQAFAVEGPTATISDPGAGGTIDINLLANRNWIDVVFKEGGTSTVTKGLKVSPISIALILASRKLASMSQANCAIRIDLPPRGAAMI